MISAARLSFSVLTLLAGVAVAQEATQSEIQSEIAQARELCETLGDFEYSPGEVIENVTDLNGDGRSEITIDYAGFRCHGAYSIYGGTAGTPLVVLISSSNGYARFEFYARSWRVVELPGQRGTNAVLLLAVHGTACGGVGADPCVAAYTWLGSRLFSVGGN